MNKIVGIYCFTDKTNGKKYIGKSDNVWARYGNHFLQSFSEGTASKFVFHRALADHPAQFDFEILEECGADELNTREYYWVDYYQTITNGYNEVPPTGGIDCYDMDMNFIKHYDSTNAAISELGLPKNGQGNIYKSYTGKTKSAYGYIWRKQGIELSERPPEKRTGSAKKVYQYSLDGELLNTYPSASACARALGVAQGVVSQCCLGKIKTVKGTRLTYNEFHE